jgi:hypothetical protein
VGEQKPLPQPPGSRENKQKYRETHHTKSDRDAPSDSSRLTHLPVRFTFSRFVGGGGAAESGAYLSCSLLKLALFIN